MIKAYYNENDKLAAQWLRELIVFKLIAPGDVDERNIEEVKAEDLRGYTQHHFFAGIGVWSHALRRAGWPDDFPVWTGSCPCQSFSASGKRAGFDDQRHVWPAWFRLIRESCPHVIFGEQVSTRDGLAWFDVVSADLESEAYTIGAMDTCAASVGAPHIRQRLYFVGESRRGVWSPWSERNIEQREESKRAGSAGAGKARKLAESDGGKQRNGELQRGRQYRLFEDDGETRELADTELRRPQQRDESERRIQFTDAHGELDKPSSARLQGHAGNGSGEGRSHTPRSVAETSASFWKNFRWHYCSDGRYRPIPAEPALFPLAARTAGRVGILRGAGNALCSPQAEAFIRAYMNP